MLGKVPIEIRTEIYNQLFQISRDRQLDLHIPTHRRPIIREHDEIVRNNIVQDMYGMLYACTELKKEFGNYLMEQSR
jgi:hypothetical protein